MSPPPDAERSPHSEGDRSQIIDVDASTTVHRSATARRESPTLAYLAGRERVLGHRVTLPEDPSAAADTLAEIHGGRRRAAAWLRRVLSEVVAP